MRKCLRSFCVVGAHYLYGEIKFWIRFHFFRKGLISEEFYGLMGYHIDWKNPQDLNEKINWLKLYGDTSRWARLADKYLVREYVRERIGEQYLSRIYGVWEHAEDIDFSGLPERFVLKTNHGAGTVLIVPNKAKLDVQKTIQQLNSWLKIKYGYKTIEPHYLSIKPLVMAEEMLKNDSDASSSIIDYKIYCFGGSPYLILVCTDRKIGGHSRYSYFDTNWKPCPNVLNESLRGMQVNLPKPVCLEEMLVCASKLAEGLPQVRVDFYIVDEHPIFGEMTMTSCGGYDNDITRECSLDMGTKITLK